MPETRTGFPSLVIPGIEDLEPIGRGGFGTVYQGWQPELRRKVAVKVLDARASDVEGAARFRLEVMAMGALSDHPNVVPVYATGAVDDRLYLVMPFLAQGSLADQLAAGPLSPAETVDLGRALADALDAAHAAGVLHRDVKPANVLCSAYGAPQLADFGVARFIDATQTMGAAPMATVAYAAPEILSGESATEASDVYSLGATLHAALRGQAPYEADPQDVPISLAVRVLSTDPPDLREAGVPAELADVVERAMARDPAGRHPSAAALRDSLASIGPAVLGPAHPPPNTGPAVAGAAAMAAVDPPTQAITAVNPTASDDGNDGGRVPPDRRPARRPLWLLGLLAVLVVLAAGALLLSRDDGDGGDTDATATPGPTTESTSPAEGTTTAPPEETTEATDPASETTAPTEDPSGSGSLPTAAEDAVRSYYALMDAGRIDEGFARLSPAYQQRTGESSYRRFWESIDGVEVLKAAGDGLAATATLRYTRDDGTTSTEQVTLTFVEDPATGGLLIDDYRVG